MPDEHQAFSSVREADGGSTGRFATGGASPQAGGEAGRSGSEAASGAADLPDGGTPGAGQAGAAGSGFTSGAGAGNAGGGAPTGGEGGTGSDGGTGDGGVAGDGGVGGATADGGTSGGGTIDSGGASGGGSVGTGGGPPPTGGTSNGGGTSGGTDAGGDGGMAGAAGDGGMPGAAGDGGLAGAAGDGGMAGAAGAGTEPFDPETGLVTHFPFDEASGTTCYDRKNAAHTATLMGVCTHVAGRFGRAIGMRNADTADYVELPDGLLSALSSATLVFWFRDLSAERQGARVLAMGTDSNNQFFVIPNVLNPSTSMIGSQVGGVLQGSTTLFVMLDSVTDTDEWDDFDEGFLVGDLGWDEIT